MQKKLANITEHIKECIDSIDNNGLFCTYSYDESDDSDESDSDNSNDSD